jgi:hypothetical protein
MLLQPSMNTPDQTARLPGPSSADSTRSSPRPDISPVGVYALVFLGLAGPALSFSQWGEWDALRWTLKSISWLAIFAGCLVGIADLRIRRVLWFTPWVAGVFAAFMVWMLAISAKPILQIAVPLTWFAIVTMWFTYLRLKVPEFFGLPSPQSLMTESTARTRAN